MANVVGRIIHQNGHIDLVHDACKLCYKGKDEKDLDGKLKYIEDKIKAGHESVIEHSNVIMLITDYGFNTNEMIEVMEASRHIHVKSHISDDGVCNYLIGGNIRAYKNIFRNISNQNNTIAKTILKTLYYTPKEYYYDFIQAGIMEVRRFVDSEVIYEEYKPRPIYDSYTDRLTISNIDNIEEIYNKLIDYMRGEIIFSVEDILEMVTVTVFFKDMSRIITQQVTRHRNPISQQSQRYVDESKAESNNPLTFTKYKDKNSKFNIDTLGEVTLDELAESMNNIYPQLRKQGLYKEDARYFLPQGVKSSLYMTFTFKSLIHFINVRFTEEAQHEIRSVAKYLLWELESIHGDFLGDVFTYLIPKYALTETDYDINTISEIIE